MVILLRYYISRPVLSNGSSRSRGAIAVGRASEQPDTCHFQVFSCLAFGRKLSLRWWVRFGLVLVNFVCEFTAKIHDDLPDEIS